MLKRKLVPGARKRLAGVSAVLGAMLTLSACGGDAGDAAGNSAPGVVKPPPVTVSKKGIVEFRKPEPGSGRGLKLGFITLGDQVPFSKLVTDSMKQNAKIAGAKLVVCDSRLDGQVALDLNKVAYLRLDSGEHKVGFITEP